MIEWCDMNQLTLNNSKGIFVSLIYKLLIVFNFQNLLYINVMIFNKSNLYVMDKEFYFYLIVKNIHLVLLGKPNKKIK